MNKKENSINDKGNLIQAKFTIHGEPKGKGRPRFSRSGNYVRTYTPNKTVSYENFVKLEYLNQCGKVKLDKDTMLEMQIKAFFNIPKSVSKKRRTLMQNGKIRPTKKPDMDNIIKIIADSLNGIAYYDDAQIVLVIACKYYSDKPRVEVTLRSAGE